ncbi:carbon-nitrogen family protein [Truncatella angustata]|uniref:Carbon-nitrogen family protein n=1 Tax=Truncatella angustata TaxID=152316 RepID=A0A9P8UQL8_9PEZI|nr:carbon-nitrogen family protein [Truncatella angustata]KAH6656401.1 carbon-nitrogen family protein [Truncatella angustata]
MAIAAVGQICSTASMTHNLEQCIKLVSKAAAAGAKVLFLPEASDYIATSAAESLSLAKPVASSPFVTGLQSAAAKHSLAVHVGIHVPVTVKAVNLQTTNPILTTVPQAKETSSSDSFKEGISTKLYNRTIWINEDGSISEKANYDKLHLFDYASLRESNSTQAGTSFTTPFQSAIGRIGSLICFDLRFPEAALHLAKPPASSAFAISPAQVLLYPSAFTVPTGRAHWEVLLRSRAIETQSWVIASAQVGRHGEGAKRVSYGKSLVVDPWGKVVVELKGVRGENEGEWEAEDGAIGEIGLVDIDLEQLEGVRERMPLIRRTDVYSEI